MPVRWCPTALGTLCGEYLQCQVRKKQHFYVINLIESNVIQCKSWLSNNLPRLTEWSTTMSTKTKGEKVFFGFSPSCLGRAMVASILSIEPLVVVSLVPRPHLYWSGYEANLISCPTHFRKKSSCCGNWTVKCCVSWTLLKSRPKDDYYKPTRYCVRVYYKWLWAHGVLSHVHSAALMCMLHESVVYVDVTWSNMVALKAARD